MAVDISPGQHAECPNTPAAQMLKRLRSFWACCRLFILQSRYVVLDCGHTSGEHSQCHETPTSHIWFVRCFSGFMAVAPAHHALRSTRLCWDDGSREPRQSTLNPPQVYRQTKMLGQKKSLALAVDTVPERLRGWTRNPLGSARRGSNPLGVIVNV